MAKHILCIGEVQKEILEKICAELMVSPIKTVKNGGKRKMVGLDMVAYTPTQLRELYKQVKNSLPMPR